MQQHVAHFANFVCRFGDEQALLDYEEEIILPAFLRKGQDVPLTRTFTWGVGTTTYFLFIDVKLVTLEKGSDSYGPRCL